MTETEQRIAIAEACGWDSKPSPVPGGAGCGFPTKKPFWCFPFHLPNYPADLNAMHEAVLTLNNETTNDIGMTQLDDFEVMLDAVCDREGIKHWLHAEARHYSEAFLRTIGKWKDSP